MPLDRWRRRHGDHDGAIQMLYKRKLPDIETAKSTSQVVRLMRTWLNSKAVLPGAK
jgi:hypothetical protein